MRHPSGLADWWLELPMRRRWWWRELLLEPGEGWLRWAPDWRTSIRYDPPDFEEWQVFPPLRRAWLAVRGVVEHPFLVAKGYVRWAEWPSMADVAMLKSDERKRMWQ